MGDYSVYPLSILHYLTKLKGKYDVVIDEINTIPFLTPLFINVPHVAFIHQLAANVLVRRIAVYASKTFSESGAHILRLYRNTPIFTSQSTKDDLLSLGFTELKFSCDKLRS